MPGRYGTPKAVVIDGIRFASKREAKRYGDLALMQRGKLIADLECQPAFTVEIGGMKFCTYTADFRYRDLGTNRTVVEEVKSTGTRKDPAYRLRRKAAELFFGITVTEILS